MSINSTSSERYIKIIRVVRLQIKTLLLTERDLGLVSEEYFDDDKQRQADESVQKVDNFLRGFFDLFVALSNDSPKVFLEQNQAESDQKLSSMLNMFIQIQCNNHVHTVIFIIMLLIYKTSIKRINVCTVEAPAVPT